MAPRDDRIWLTDREWKSNCEALEMLQRSVEKLERENLIFKTKAAMAMAIIGVVASVVTQIVVTLLTHK